MAAIIRAMFVIFALDHRVVAQAAQRRAADRLPPVERGRRDAVRFQYRVVAQAGDDLRPVPFPEPFQRGDVHMRSEEHTSELQSLMRISYAVFCLKKKKKNIEYKKNKH